MPDEFQQVLNEIDNILQQFVDRVFELSQERLAREGKTDTGTLLKTANVNRGFLEAEIVYPASYADNVHYGRVAGTMPPVEPLQKWARRKLGLSEKEALSVGWAIAKAIEARGIQACPYLTDSINQALAEFENKQFGR